MRRVSNKVYTGIYSSAEHAERVRLMYHKRFHVSTEVVVVEDFLILFARIVNMTPGQIKELLDTGSICMSVLETQDFLSRCDQYIIENGTPEAAADMTDEERQLETQIAEEKQLLKLAKAGRAAPGKRVPID